MKKILFLIHDLGQGGAEKVLVNLVNNMDRTKFDISVKVLFAGGVNEQFLKEDVHFSACFPRDIPGNSKLMKLLSPKQLFRLFIRENYDIIVSYLEGPSARIVSGCPNKRTKLFCWIHSMQHTREIASSAFRSFREASHCYSRYNRIFCVSSLVKASFQKIFSIDNPVDVLYNTVESGKILALAQEETGIVFSDSVVNLIGVGSLKISKGFHRLIQIQKRLSDAGQRTHLYILGKGPERKKLEKLAAELGIENQVTFLGYQTNPYRFVAKSDLFLCASQSEGFSTAATEALIVGTPVCTVAVSGMAEMLGEDNEYGVIVPNDDEALYQGIYDLVSDPLKLAHYKAQAQMRGKLFSTEETVRKTEEMLLEEEA